MILPFFCGLRCANFQTIIKEKHLREKFSGRAPIVLGETEFGSGSEGRKLNQGCLHIAKNHLMSIDSAKTASLILSA